MLFNKSRAVAYMQRCGLDALVATSPVNITYFTDYVCWLDPLFKEYMMRPGVGGAGGLWEALTARGVTASFPHGHGLGLEVRDCPILVADNGLRIRDDCVDVASDLPLEADMVINLEAAIFTPGVGSLHLEQSFLVTPEGRRLLVPQDRTRPVQP